MNNNNDIVDKSQVPASLISRISRCENQLKCRGKGPDVRHTIHQGHLLGRRKVATSLGEVRNRAPSHQGPTSKKAIYWGTLNSWILAAVSKDTVLFTKLNISPLSGNSISLHSRLAETRCQDTQGVAPTGPPWDPYCPASTWGLWKGRGRPGIPAGHVPQGSSPSSCPSVLLKKQQQEQLSEQGGQLRRQSRPSLSKCPGHIATRRYLHREAKSLAAPSGICGQDTCIPPKSAHGSTLLWERTQTINPTRKAWVRGWRGRIHKN